MPKMTGNEFAKKILDEVSELEKQLRTDSKHDVLSNARSALILQRLKTMVDSFKDDKNILPTERLQSFRTLLTHQLQLRDTNVNYFREPESIGNKALFHLVEVMASHDPTLNKFKLLFPFLNSDSIERLQELKLDSPEDFSCLKKFVLSDDQQQLIDVKQCLYFSRIKNDIKLYDWRNRELSESEFKKVVHHSVFTKRYYKTLVMLVSSTDKLKNITLTEELIAIEENMKVCIQDNKYELSSLYGDEAEKLVIDSIFSVVTGKGSLISMLESLPRSQWVDFINQAHERLELLPIILGADKNVDNLLRREKGKSTEGGELRTRIRQFLVIFAYCLERGQEENFQSMGGWTASLFPKLTGVYDSKTKMALGKVSLNFVAVPPPAGESLKDVLEKTAHKSAFTNGWLMPATTFGEIVNWISTSEPSPVPSVSAGK